MRRFLPALCIPLVLLGGCRIERTPSAYIDRLESPEEEIRAATEELLDRLLSTGPSLQRRNLGDVSIALAPHAELSGIGPDAEIVRGDTELLRLLDETTAGRNVAIEDVRVEIEPGSDVAWFRSVLVVSGDSVDAGRMPFTGVFVHEDGEWRLRQSHLSGPITPPADSLPPADSAAAAG